jgi:LacI family transcriptional regulator
VSIVTHDDELGYLKNGGEYPIFTATRSSVRDAGRRCARMLLRQIELGQKAPVAPTFDLLEAPLIVGASTGPAPNP